MYRRSGSERDLPNSPDPAERPGPPLEHMRRSPTANALQDAVVFLYPLGITIVLTPVILHFIGPERYGIYALAMVFVSFIGLIDVGMAPVVVRFLSTSLASSDLREARSVLGVGLLFYIAIGLIGAGLALVGGQLLPKVLSLPPGLRSTATFVISVAGFGFFFASLLSPVASIPGALQRFDSTTYASLISTTATAAGSVVVLSLGWGVRALIVVTSLQPALMLVLVARSNRRLMPSLTIRPAYDGPLLRKMVSFSGYSFVSNMAGTILFQVDKFVLGALANVSLVTYYVVPGNVAQRLHTAMSSVTGVALPVSADLHARGEHRALNDFYVRATRATALVIVSLTVPVFVFSRQLLREWVGETFATTSFGTLRLLLLTYALLALTPLPYYVSLGIGRPRILAGFNVVTAVINVVLIMILIPRYGLIGAAVAYFASTVTVPVLIYYIEHQLLALERSPWPSLIVRLGLIGVGQGVACLLVRPLATGLAQVIVLTLLGAAFAPVLAWTTGYLTPQDRAAILRAVPTGHRLASRRSADSTSD
jgi:O-antigen/teichoic acid export membrane protein